VWLTFPPTACWSRPSGTTTPHDANRDRLLWLLLDGVNEADRFADLVRALDAFLPVLSEAPRTRLLTSMRSGAFHSLAARDATLGAHGAPVFSHAERLRPYRYTVLQCMSRVVAHS
jgi:hypothetical protein